MAVLIQSVRPVFACLRGASRNFSTTPSLISNTVPPESPSYIDVPEPPQSEEKKLPRVRGALPVPREIFPRIEGNRKIRPEYLEQSAPKPTNRPVPRSEAQEWRLTMAEARRKNLKRGLRDLWDRRATSDSARKQRATNKFEKKREMARAPEREDERLTRATILDAIMDTKVYPDPERFIRASRSSERVAARESAKREARREALMELYINASNFIVQESELKKEIDRQFNNNYFKREISQKGKHSVPGNIWGIHGNPPSIGNMLGTVSNSPSGHLSSSYHDAQYSRTLDRHKKLAESLTGGKMA